jgi:hypothetical protein
LKSTVHWLIECQNFQSSILHPFSGYKNKPRKKLAEENNFISSILQILVHGPPPPPNIMVSLVMANDLKEPVPSKTWG